jgi:hypothetical protein
VEIEIVRGCRFTRFQLRVGLHTLMFCPSCAAEYTIGLNYCNRCGANLSTAPASNEIVAISLTKPTLIITATLLLLTLGGFAGIISGAIEMTRAVGGGDLSMALVFFGMLTILVVDIFLARQLSKLINASLAGYKLPRAKQPSTPFANELPPRPVTARFEPAPSVTEHTTRFFEKTYTAPELEAQKTADELKS